KPQSRLSQQEQSGNTFAGRNTLLRAPRYAELLIKCSPYMTDAFANFRLRAWILTRTSLHQVEKSTHSKHVAPDDSLLESVLRDVELRLPSCGSGRVCFNIRRIAAKQAYLSRILTVFGRLSVISMLSANSLARLRSLARIFPKE